MHHSTMHRLQSIIDEGGCVKGKKNASMVLDSVLLNSDAPDCAHFKLTSESHGAFDISSFVPSRAEPGELCARLVTKIPSSWAEQPDKYRLYLVSLGKESFLGRAKRATVLVCERKWWPWADENCIPLDFHGNPVFSFDSKTKRYRIATEFIDHGNLEALLPAQSGTLERHLNGRNIEDSDSDDVHQPLNQHNLSSSGNLNNSSHKDLSEQSEIDDVGESHTSEESPELEESPGFVESMEHDESQESSSQQQHRTMRSRLTVTVVVADGFNFREESQRYRWDRVFRVHRVRQVAVCQNIHVKCIILHVFGSPLRVKLMQNDLGVSLEYGDSIDTSEGKKKKEKNVAFSAFGFRQKLCFVCHYNLSPFR